MTEVHAVGRGQVEFAQRKRLLQEPFSRNISVAVAAAVAATAATVAATTAAAWARSVGAAEATVATTTAFTAAATTKATFTAATAAATTTEATTAATKATFTAGRAGFHGACFVHDDGAATQGLTIGAIDGGLRFCVAAHFHKAEAFGTACVTFHHDLGAGHSAELAALRQWRHQMHEDASDNP